jgi:hypothetical protein
MGKTLATGTELHEIILVIRLRIKPYYGLQNLLTSCVSIQTTFCPNSCGFMNTLIAKTIYSLLLAPLWKRNIKEQKSSRKLLHL